MLDMYVRSVLYIFLVLIVSSCASNANQNSHAPGTFLVNVESVAPASELGVTVDENLQVLDLDPQGAALLAGIQIGDILIDLTMVEMSENTPTPSDHIVIESPLPTPTVTNTPAPLPPEAGRSSVHDEAAPLVTAVAPGEGEVINEAVPFTDRDEVRTLIGLGATVKLKFNRGGNLLEVILKTTPRAPRPDSPTPTPVLPPYDYF